MRGSTSDPRKGALLSGWRSRSLKRSHQLAPHRLRHHVGVRGIHIRIQNQRPVQQLPVFAQQVKHAPPVEPPAACLDQMHDISAVKSLAKRDEAFRGDALLGAKHAAGYAQHDSGSPRSIHEESITRLALPTPVMRSTKCSPRRAFASHTGSSTQVANPACSSRAKAAGISHGARKKSISLVVRQMPV